MTDNVQFQAAELATPAASVVVATDNILGVNYQRMKVGWGIDGVYVDTSATDPLPVVLTAGAVVIGHVITDSGSTTAVTQATAANLNATVVGTGTFAVQVTSAPVTHIIADSGTITTVGTVTTVTTVSAARIVGNTGAVLDGVNTAATAPANGVLGLGIYNSTEPSPTTGQSVGIQLDAKGRQRQVIMDAAGNTRGANVNSSNQLSVSVDAITAGTSTIGKVYTAYQTTKALTNAAITISSSGDNTIVSGTAAQTIRVFKLVLVAAAAVNVTLKNDTAGTALTGAMPLTANGAITIDSDESGEPEFVSASGGNFVVNLSGAQTVTGYVQYTKS